MGPNTQLLCARLRDVIQLLERVGASYWADWMQTALTRIERSDFSGVEKVCGAYGGMGSFNDLIIQLGPHQIAANEADGANEELERLRGEIYELAMLIKRDVVIE